MRSSGESSRRSSGGRLGRQLGRLGPLIGRRVFLVGRTHLSGTTLSLVGGDPGVPMSHRGQRLICHQECLAPMLYLVEGHKFLFVTKTFHVPNINLKMKCKILGKCAPCHMCKI
jgi:hypothetical protein